MLSGMITREQREVLYYLLILGLPLLFLILFFIAPMEQVIRASFGREIGVGQAYASLFRTRVYIEVFRNTLFITAWVVVSCLVIGYILAFTLFRASSKWFYLLLILLLSPLLMNQLSRNFAWMVILDSHGLINGLFRLVGLSHQPLELIYNRFGVIVVLIHGFIPIMTLSIYMSLSSIGRDLPLASYSLGANSWQTFRYVYLPLSLPGVLAGSFFVAILTFGYYITPAMLGGSKGIMIARVIDQLLNRQGDEQMATAVSTVLILICLPSVFFLMRTFNNLRRETSL
jgi:ABC-type spermidine/putrescine transport system permease subunit I